jgi:hypothetical protein
MQRHVRKGRRDRDDALMRSQRQAIEKPAPLELHGNVSLLGRRQQRTKRRIVRTILRNMDRAERFSRDESFRHGMNPVDEIVKIKSTCS